MFITELLRRFPGVNSTQPYNIVILWPWQRELCDLGLLETIMHRMI